MGGRTAVTGATGYLGGALVARLRSDGAPVSALVRRKDASLPADVRVVVGAVHDPCALSELTRDAVVLYNLAAVTDRLGVEDDPLGSWRTNVEPIVHLGRASRRLALVQAGSITQVGALGRAVVTEAVRDQPASMYDLEKLMAEQYVEYYSRVDAIDGISLRLPSIFGPGNEERSSSRGFLNKMIRRAVDGKPIEIDCSIRGRRPFLYIDDAVDALLAGHRLARIEPGSHYFVAGTVALTFVEAAERVVDVVAALTGARSEIVQADFGVPDHRLDQRDFVVTGERFASSTGWRPAMGFDEGIRRTAQALLDAGCTP